MTSFAKAAPVAWPAYLDGPQHSSYSAAEMTITPGAVAKLVQKWHYAAGGGFLASPTVADGAVYIGSDTGWFYKLSLTTGKLLHRTFTGLQADTTCPAEGTVSTATVADDPKTHRPTVYVEGADGYLYALNASNLKLRWKSVIAIPSTSVNNYFDWSSPTVANGKIYVGVASSCDNPLVRAGVIGYAQATGRKFGEFYTVPKGDVGGSVWSSIGVAPGGDVYATTGNGPEGSAATQLLGYSESIIKLSATLKFLGRFQVPPRQVIYDADFGGSPVFFDRYVGACDKNGIFYAVHQSTMKLAWERRVGASAEDGGCIAAPVWNGKRLFIAGPATTIGGTSYRGFIGERDPGDGKLIWETGLPNGVAGSPTMDGGGVIAVGTYDSTATPNATYLVSAGTGKILRNLVMGTDFAQSVFADNWLFTANTNGVYAWGIGRAA